jgi:polygalacturonase
MQESIFEDGTELIFSPNFADYLPAVFTRWEGVECYNYSPLIYANGCEHIALTGNGRILGNKEAVERIDSIPFSHNVIVRGDGP